MDWIPKLDIVTGKDSAPAFRLEIDNKDISERIQSRLMSLTMTDNRGLEADQLDIELDDADNILQLPSRGNILSLELGWHGHPLTPKGKFIVDEIEHSGAPDRLTIRARSADFRGITNTKREESFHNKKIGEIVRTIAEKNNLIASIGKDIENIIIHIDQTNESDSSFLTRLAKREGIVASIKNGELIFIRQGQNKTASGKDIPTVVINRQSGDNHRFTLADRQAYTGVTVQWQDTRNPKKKQTVSVRSGKKYKGEINYKEKREIKLETKQKASMKYTKSKSKSKGKIQWEREQTASMEFSRSESMDKKTAYLIGSEDNKLVLSHIYPDKASAVRAAEATWKKMQQGVASFSIQLALGRADLYPETPVKVIGFKPEIDAAEWTLIRATHTINQGGFTTALELEVKVNDLDMK
ncbi:phage late control D family protein [Photorhabdus temperata]|uniref:Phage protein D n=1 Tax=Photorhabdus temperata subsp. temperata Meg1 TaxID=1393735 RepID=A0A081RRQ9_PHOTE|nr:phage late control D family protein [Photorhabdus temperata]KER01362.1 phage protein D [Photorhabdus temperata subsp. temperata Meg1]